MAQKLMVENPSKKIAEIRARRRNKNGTHLGIIGAAALIVIAIYYWIYMGCTPEECLMPGQWGRFWR